MLSHVRLFATPWTAALQVPLSVEFSRQEYWRVAISFSIGKTCTYLQNSISEKKKQNVSINSMCVLDWIIFFSYVYTFVKIFIIKKYILFQAAILIFPYKNNHGLYFNKQSRNALVISQDFTWWIGYWFWMLEANIKCLSWGKYCWTDPD